MFILNIGFRCTEQASSWKKNYSHLFSKFIDQSSHKHFPIRTKYSSNRNYKYENDNTGKLCVGVCGYIHIARDMFKSI